MFTLGFNKDSIFLTKNILHEISLYFIRHSSKTKKQLYPCENTESYQNYVECKVVMPPEKYKWRMQILPYATTG